jgi:hypothetical protein
MSKFIVIGACSVRGTITNTWVASNTLTPVSTEQEAESILIQEISSELDEYIQNEWDDPMDEDVHAFINSHCEVFTSEEHNMVQVRFDDDDGIDFLFRVIEMDD